jgi:hypothetical protein
MTNRIGGGDRGKDRQGRGHVRVRMGGWLAQDHLGDVDEGCGLFSTGAGLGGGAGNNP